MKMLPYALRCILVTTLTLLAASVFSGCKSYQFGNAVELPFQSIYIKPVANDSFAPQAQALLSAQIRDAFIRDGRARLVTSEEDADAVLLVNLTEYKRRASARRKDDTVLASSFDLTLVAEVSLFNQNKGDYFFQGHRLENSSNAYVSDLYQAPGATSTQDFLQSEYQAMPLLTRDLARQIADEVLSPWAQRN